MRRMSRLRIVVSVLRKSLTIPCERAVSRVTLRMRLPLPLLGKLFGRRRAIPASMASARATPRHAPRAILAYSPGATNGHRAHVSAVVKSSSGDDGPELLNNAHGAKGPAAARPPAFGKQSCHGRPVFLIQFLCQKRNSCYHVWIDGKEVARSEKRCCKAKHGKKKREREWVETVCLQPEARVGYFLFFRPQPFEKPRFGKTNESKCKPFYFHLFEFTYPELALRLP
jgi:hypothetical protein